jgi:hypothetical protein
MKQELRCHAVLCPSENKAKKMCKKLHERLHQVKDSTLMKIFENFDVKKYQKFWQKFSRPWQF